MSAERDPVYVEPERVPRTERRRQFDRPNRQVAKTSEEKTFESGFSLWSSPFIVGSLREMVTTAKTERLTEETSRGRLTEKCLDYRQINKFNKILEIRDDVIKQRDEEILLCKTELYETTRELHKTKTLINDLMKTIQIQRRALDQYEKYAKTTRT